MFLTRGKQLRTGLSSQNAMPKEIEYKPDDKKVRSYFEAVVQRAVHESYVQAVGFAVSKAIKQSIEESLRPV